MESRPTTARAPTGAVDAAALARIAELETLLAEERTESARRLHEVEPRIEQFRTALRSLHQKLKQAAEERVVLDARLAGEIDETERLGRRIEELEGQMAGAGRQDAGAAARADAPAADMERTGEFAQDAGPATAAGAAQDDARPDVIGLRIDGEPEVLALGRRYEAHDTDSRRDVQILVFAQSLAKLNGARLDALLLARHPNLASAIAFGRTRARPYVVFERAPGETLEEWVRRAGPASETAALRVALQIARGLREASFHGALHGDLSPRNVRVTQTGDVKVEDTGLADLHPAAVRPLASPEYAAPERLRDGAAADSRADMFSLGAVLHFVLTGRAPFEKDGPRPAGAGPDPRRRRSTVSAPAAELVSSLTDHEPAARPATWDDAVLAIERLAAGSGVAEVAPREPGAVARFVAAHPYAATAVAAAPILAVALWLRLGPGLGPSARERFDAAARQADVLAQRGDPVGAAFTLGRYLKDTGDAAVERDAAARLQKLRLR